MNKKTVLCVLALVAAHTAFAQQYDSEFDFAVRPVGDGKSVEITRYAGNKETVNIPPRIEGLPVTRIGARVFLERMREDKPNRLKSITIPASVTSIGQEAFDSCSLLTSVTFAENSQLKTIGDGAFYSCGITSITLPASVTTIEKEAFWSCSLLTSVTIPASLKTLGASAFKGCRSLTGSITLPAGLTSIGPETFAHCENLTGITIPASVTTIGHLAFFGCISVASITIPAGVTSIGNRAFGNWKDTQTINVRGPTIGWDRGWRIDCKAQIVDQRQ